MAVTTTEARFSTVLNWRGTVAGEQLVIRGLFELVRHESVGDDGTVRRTRTLEGTSLNVVGAGGRRYGFASSTTRIDTVRDVPDRVVLIDRGILVGRGPLNNVLLDLVICFRENHGSADAEVSTALVADLDADWKDRDDG